MSRQGHQGLLDWVRDALLGDLPHFQSGVVTGGCHLILIKGVEVEIQDGSRVAGNQGRWGPHSATSLVQAEHSQRTPSTPPAAAKELGVSFQPKVLRGRRIRVDAMETFLHRLPM